jgi:mRNA interferase MazF
MLVVLHFPFSDLTQTKRRPALVLATLSGDDVIRDEYSVALTGSDFASGGLNRDSSVRPNRLFTADSSIVLYRAGQLNRSGPRRIEANLLQ